MLQEIYTIKNDRILARVPCETNTNYKPHHVAIFISKVRDPTFLFYTFVLLYVFYMSYQKIKEKSFLQLIFCSRVTRKRVKMAWSGMLQEIYTIKNDRILARAPVQLTLIINHIMLQSLYRRSATLLFYFILLFFYTFFTCHIRK